MSSALFKITSRYYEQVKKSVSRQSSTNIRPSKYWNFSLQTVRWPRLLCVRALATAVNSSTSLHEDSVDLSIS